MKWDSQDPFTPWKHWLEPFYESGKLRIIGEIPLSYEEVEQLGWVCTLILKDQGMTNGSDTLYYDYPLFMLTLMPKFAAYNTARDYWQAFADFLDVEKTALYNQQRWHRCFVELAQERGFRVFRHSENPNPYVASIRFQGGIPAYSLPDFFDKMVLPAVEKPGLRELSPEAALDYLRGHVYFVDSPVLNFLEYSGEFGVNYFSESCRLAKYALENKGEILGVDEVYLPEYVIRAFETYLEHREDVRQHWKKPFIQAAPYSEDTAVNLNLPEQEISLDLSASRLFWRITYPDLGGSEERACRISRRRQNVVTQVDYLPVPSPVNGIEVSLNAVRDDGQEIDALRRWNLTLLPRAGGTPLVGFNTDGIQLGSSRQLPAEVLYLLTPLGSTLEFDGSGRLVEKCIPLVGEWADWQMDCWNLGDAWSVMLAKGGQPLGDVVPVSGIIAQPDLVGGHLFQFQDLEDPLYTTDLPSIRVPLVSGNTPQARVSSWTVQVRSLGDANPSLNRTIKLSEFVDEVTIEEDRGIFPLKHLLGEKPAGTYEIRAFGPRGLGAEFRVRLWPKLLLQGHSIQMMQPAQNAQPMKFIICLQDGATCQPQPGAEGIEIQPTVGMWQVTVPAELNRALLELHAPANGGGTVRMPVSIPLPKLRWGLATDGHGDQLAFGQALIHRSIDQLLQAGSSSLHVEMYGLGKLINELKLRLVDLNDEEAVLQEAKLYHTDFTRDWLRVTLGQFIGSVRTVASSARFELVYIPYGRDIEEVLIPLMEVSHALDIREVALTQVGEIEWKLTWKEDRPLRNRRVMLLPAWQPWQEAWEFKIPNNARGQFLLEGVALPPSRYHLYFYVLPGYEPPLGKPPRDLAPIVIDLCTPEERIAAIPIDGTSANERFRNLVELAVINHAIGNGKERDNRLSQAAINLVHITKLDLLTGVLEWLRDQDVDKPIKSFFFNSMFHNTILASMLKHYSPHEPSLMEYLGYTATVKNIPADSAKLMLNNVNDPVAVASCLRQLIKKKDDEVISIIEQMMRNSRLSKQDAVELLSAELKWAIEKIAELQPDPVIDTLLSGMLWKIYQLPEYMEDTRVLDWIVRAIPFEEDEQVVKVYLIRLFDKKQPQRFEVLMRAFLDGKLLEDEVMEFLSNDPRSSLDALENAPASEEHQKWVNWLIEKFPAAAGFVMPNSRLATPFGEAVIDYIEKWNDGRVDNLRLGEPDHLLNVLVGIGLERIRLLIDYHEMTLKIEGETHVWKCGHCSYMHPLARYVTRHASREHRDVNVIQSLEKMPRSFEKEDIRILIDEE